MIFVTPTQRDICRRHRHPHSAAMDGAPRYRVDDGLSEGCPQPGHSSLAQQGKPGGFCLNHSSTEDLALFTPTTSGSAYLPRRLNRSVALSIARKPIGGQWFALRPALRKPVSAEDFAKLSQGQHPQTGEQLVRQRASYESQDTDGKTIKTMEHRAGWDATFSAPKSVSLTALVGGDDRVREAHRESVRIALDQLEPHASPHRRQSSA